MSDQTNDTTNMRDDYSDILTAAAMAAFVADHARPECGCVTEYSYEPATPENHAIRDAMTFITDSRNCTIPRHRNPWGRER